MNRKVYIISLVVLLGGTAALLITNMIFDYMSVVIPFVFFFLGYLFLKYRIDGAVQVFSTRFSMMIDYDLDTEGAIKMAKESLEKAPNASLKSMYQFYVGQAQYYQGDYEEAIKSFNLVDLQRSNPILHVLVFVFTAYCAFELKDQELFDQSYERLNAVKGRINARQQGFVNSYIEIIDAIKNMDVAIDRYKEVIESHFSEDKGFILRRINYKYRLSYYYAAVGDDMEADKCLAFCIANGKEVHFAKRAKEMFKGLVNVEDFIWDPMKEKTAEEPEGEVIESIEASEVVAEPAEEPVETVVDEPESEDEKKEE